mmetsp:Transcript_7991/g.28429  ORF Transcript_7991/g.28429 Transcript_7991/m.28429 type:complete len:150 (+) Transcript_7991:168-617(+)
MRAAMDGGCALFSPRVRIQGRREGSLHGLTFVAKDLFAVKGWRTSFGTPKWRDTHETAQENAEAVERMLQSGAELVGMAHMDEMAYSLNGENAQFGTPVNPRGPRFGNVMVNGLPSRTLYWDQAYEKGSPWRLKSHVMNCKKQNKGGIK